jgi:hypothetical protein
VELNPQDATLAAYERGARQYAERTTTAAAPEVATLLARVAAGAHVLELGSGPGRDAAALEYAGLTVDRTDGAAAFVDAQRAAGHRARVLDVDSCLRPAGLALRPPAGRPRRRS